MGNYGDHLREIARRADNEGGKAAAVAMAAEAERGIKAKLGERSHPRGTPTPSAPGQPPALITGTLRRSVIGQPARRIGAGRWEAAVGPTAVQARIQELGGRTGRNHATTLPPRPSVRPAVSQLRATGRLDAVAAAAFRRATYGG